MEYFILAAERVGESIRLKGRAILRNVKVTSIILTLFFVLPNAYSQCTAIIGSNIDPAEGCETLTIQFYDLSAGVVSRTWNFGDGSLSVGAQNPVHSFSTAGRDTSFVVRLTITCASGTSFSTRTVRVFAKPKVRFSSNKNSVCAITDSVCLINKSDYSPTNSYLWNFGDGTVSDKFETCKTFSTPGIYDMTLTVINAEGCLKDSSIAQFIKVEQIPSTAFSVNAFSGCSPFNVVFTNNTDTVGTDYSNWTWDFGDGEPPYLGFKPPVHTYTKPGEYSVTLGTRNSIGCYNFSTQKIVVKAAPVARFTSAPVACQNENLQIQYSGSYSVAPSFNWGFDSPVFVSGSGEGPYLVRWSEAGNKNITLTVSEAGCSSSVSEKVQVNPITKVFLKISSDLDTICSNEMATFTALPSNYANYSFYVNAGLVQNSILNSYSGSGFSNKDRIYAGVTDINGCTQIVSDTLVLNVLTSPQITLSSSSLNDTICYGETLSFSSLPAGYEEYCFYVGNDPVQKSSSNVFNTAGLTDKQRVYATANNNDCVSKNSNSIITTIKGTLPPPQVFCGTTTSSSIEFRWDQVPDAVSYEISLDNAPFTLPSSGAAGFTHLLTGLSSNEPHSLRVRGIDASICGKGIISLAATCTAIDCEEILYNQQDPKRVACENDNVSLSINGITLPDYSITWNNEPGTNSNYYSLIALNDTTIPVSVRNLAAPLCPPVEKSFTVLVSQKPGLSLKSSADGMSVCAGSSIIFTASPANLAYYAFFENNKLVQAGPDNVYTAKNPINGRRIFVSAQNGGCEESTAAISMSVSIPLLTPQVNYNFSTDNSVVFYWGAVPGALGYMVSVNSGPYIVPSSGSTGLNHKVNGSSSGDAVTISVIALGDGICGNSEFSQPAIGFAENCNSFSYSLTTQYSICKGDTIQLKINGLNLSNYEVAWGSLPPTQSKTIDVIPSADTVISVSIRNLDKPFCPKQVSYITVKVNNRPAKPVLTSSDPDNNVCQGETVKFTANPPGYDLYEFYSGYNLLSSGYNNFYEPSDLKNGQQVSARAYNQGCASETGNEIVFSVHPKLNTPQVYPGSSTTNTISFAWDSVPGATGYMISINGLSFITPSSGILGLSHEVTGLIAGDSAKAQIIAIGNSPCGNSHISNLATGYAIACDGIRYSINPDTSVCEGQQVSLDISNVSVSHYSVSWNVGSFGGQTSFVYTGNADTTIIVAVKNNDQLQCPLVTKQVSIDVSKVPLLKIYSDSPNDSICEGESIGFSALPFTFDRYVFYNGLSVIQDSGVNRYLPNNLANNSNIYVKAYLSNGCSTVSDSVLSTIIPSKSLALTASKTGSLCKNELVQFTATPGFDKYSFSDNQSLILESSKNVADIYINNSFVTLSATDVHHCVSISPDTLRYSPMPLPVVSIYCSTDTICYSDFATYFTEPSDLLNYRFYNRDTILFQSGTSNLYVTDSLKYGSVISVIGIDNNGCKSQPASSLFPYIIPYPDSRITSAADGICLSDSITLIANIDNLFPGASYYWSTGETSDSIRVSPAYQTRYSLFYNLGQCKNRVIDSKNVRVDRLTPPVANAGEDVTICINDSIQLVASGGLNYSWNNFSSLDNPLEFNPLAKPAITTVYIVTVSNEFCYSRDSVKVTIDRCLESLTDPVPQIITPNNDGINDYWVVYNIDYFEHNNVEIFNRWGNLVYKKSPYDNTWDGKNMNGNDLPDGTYFYILNLANGSPTQNGFIIIHR